jgi:hypothetical protein
MGVGSKNSGLVKFKLIKGTLAFITKDSSFGLVKGAAITKKTLKGTDLLSLTSHSHKDVHTFLVLYRETSKKSGGKLCLRKYSLDLAPLEKKCFTAVDDITEISAVHNGFIVQSKKMYQVFSFDEYLTFNRNEYSFVRTIQNSEYLLSSNAAGYEVYRITGKIAKLGQLKKSQYNCDIAHNLIPKDYNSEELGIVCIQQPKGTRAQGNNYGFEFISFGKGLETSGLLANYEINAPGVENVWVFHNNGPDAEYLVKGSDLSLHFFRKGSAKVWTREEGLSKIVKTALVNFNTWTEDPNLGWKNYDEAIRVGSWDP